MDPHPELKHLCKLVGRRETEGCERLPANLVVLDRLPRRLGQNCSQLMAGDRERCLSHSFAHKVLIAKSASNQRTEVREDGPGNGLVAERKREGVGAVFLLGDCEEGGEVLEVAACDHEGGWQAIEKLLTSRLAIEVRHFHRAGRMFMENLEIVHDTRFVQSRFFQRCEHDVLPPANLLQSGGHIFVLLEFLVHVHALPEVCDNEGAVTSFECCYHAVNIVEIRLPDRRALDRRKRLGLVRVRVARDRNHWHSLLRKRSGDSSTLLACGSEYSNLRNHCSCSWGGW
mmetsp:Transcript_38613/g.91131  ORF Transcript_38613/g.91131 Transcript_38613/m.91131 type:complete len:286 (-) Transcript_38613:47-904(-)